MGLVRTGPLRVKRGLCPERCPCGLWDPRGRGRAPSSAPGDSGQRPRALLVGRHVGHGTGRAASGRTRRPLATPLPRGPLSPSPSGRSRAQTHRQEGRSKETSMHQESPCVGPACLERAEEKAGAGREGRGEAKTLHLVPTNSPVELPPGEVCPHHTVCSSVSRRCRGGGGEGDTVTSAGDTPGSGHSGPSSRGKAHRPQAAGENPEADPGPLGLPSPPCFPLPPAPPTSGPSIHLPAFP